MNEMVEKNSFQVMKDLSGYFKDGQREAIYNSADNLRDKALIRLLWVTGRRINEILNIKVSDIDMKINRIVIHISKKTKQIKDEFNNKIRVKNDLTKLKPIDKYTKDLLNYYINQFSLLPNDYLFKSDFKDNKPISRQRAFQIIRKACYKAGIFKVGNSKPHPHHFRHSFAIDMAKRMKTPADVRKLQLLLDHSNLGVTEQYLQFSDQEASELVEGVYEHQGKDKLNTSDSEKHLSE